MNEFDWMRLVATLALTGWGLLGIYSGIRNDGKSRFLTMGGLSSLFDKYEDQRTITRLKNIFWGLLSFCIGVGLLCIQFKKN